MARAPNPKVQKKIAEAVDQARRHLRQREPRKALEVLKIAERNHGRLPVILNFRAQAHAALGQRSDAIACLKSSLGLAPKQSAIEYNLGLMLFEDGQYREATERLEAAVAASDTPERFAATTAGIFFLVDETDKADYYSSLALESNPNNAKALLIRGHVANARSDADEARKAYQASLSIQPVEPDGHFGLSELNDYTPDHPHIRQMQDVLRTNKLPPKAESKLRFGLGNALEKAGQIHEACDMFLEANRLRREGSGFDIEAERARFAAIAKDLPDAGDPGLNVTPLTERRPLFVVGLPRSGTTLTEQILGSHSRVEPLGELAAMVVTVNRVNHEPGRPLLERLADIRKEYLSRARPSEGDVDWFTDKRPLNFRNVGYILSALPEAKVVHLQRHPFHTCWSIFKRPFEGEGSEYTFDLDELVAYYKLYADLMDVWAARFPDRFLNVVYEELVAQPQEQVARILDFAGLDWEDGCLEFHRNDRITGTASRYQVRQPIFRNSSDKAERFRPYVPEFASALDALALDANRPKG